MASLTQWTWVWVDSGSWWWTRRPGVLWFMGSQRVRQDWVTELNWYVESKKKWYKWAYLWSRKRFTGLENKHGCWAGGEGKNSGEGIGREFGMDIYILLYLKWITNKDILHNIWKSSQCYLAAWMERKFRGKWTHILLLFSHCHVWLFYDHMECSLPGFSVHGISQARILEWVAISFSKILFLMFSYFKID